MSSCWKRSACTNSCTNDPSVDSTTTLPSRRNVHPERPSPNASQRSAIPSIVPRRTEIRVSTSRTARGFARCGPSFYGQATGSSPQGKRSKVHDPCTAPQIVSPRVHDVTTLGDDEEVARMVNSQGPWDSTTTADT